MLMLCTKFVDAQIERWVYTYNGPENDYDWAYAIVYGLDGNIYAAGESFWHFTVISTDSIGSERWVYRHDSTVEETGVALSIACGLDGNVYAAGQMSDTNGSYLSVTSLTPLGTERWTYLHSQLVNSDEGAEAIVYGEDNNIYVAGKTTGSDSSGDFTVISLTPGGDTNWVYQYNGPGAGFDNATAIVFGLDGNIYVAGTSNRSRYVDDLIVISLSVIGEERWIYRYYGWGFSAATDIVYGSDHNIYVAGWSTFSSTYEDFTVISVDTLGNERWLYFYSGGYLGDYAHDLVYGFDGNLYVCGESYGSDYFGDFIVISLTASGNERWIYKYDEAGSSSCVANSIVYGSDGYIYSAGWTSDSITWISDFTVISLTPSGIERWRYKYNGPGDTYDEASSIVYGLDGIIYAAGASMGDNTNFDFTLVSIDPINGISEYPPPLQKTINELVLFPTLFSDRIYIRFNATSDSPLKIDLYDILGVSVYEKSFPITPSCVEINERCISELPKGVYLLVVSKSNFVYQARKLIKL